MRRSQKVIPVGESGLERLLRLERELDLKLAGARSEADRILDEARREAGAVAEREERSAEEAEAALVRRLAEERAAASASIREVVARSRDRLRGLEPRLLDGMAERVLARLLDDVDGGAVP